MDVHRAGLDVLRARLGRSAGDGFDEADEHHRYQLYVDALLLARENVDDELLAIVLQEPDRLVSQSALLVSVDSAAARFTSAELRRWSEERSAAIWQHEFNRRRLSEWLLYKELLEGNVERREEILQSTDWLQRKVAADADRADVLEMLADRGRTRRVRSLAESRLRNA